VDIWTLARFADPGTIAEVSETVAATGVRPPLPVEPG
jgi:hypothetical protein